MHGLPNWRELRQKQNLTYVSKVRGLTIGLGRCGGQVVTVPCLLLRRSEFKSRRLFQFFSVRLVFEKTENKIKMPALGHF